MNVKDRIETRISINIYLINSQHWNWIGSLEAVNNPPWLVPVNRLTCKVSH